MGFCITENQYLWVLQSDRFIPPVLLLKLQKICSFYCFNIIISVSSSFAYDRSFYTKAELMIHSVLTNVLLYQKKLMT